MPTYPLKINGAVRRCMRSSSGFTLIEILVVLFIISIMTGLAVANMPQFADNAELDEEAKRIKLLLQLARDEAIVTSTEFGFKPEENSYSFYLYDELNQNWVLNENKPFQLRELPDAISLEVDIDGEPLVLEALNDTEFDSDSSSGARSKKKSKQPDILILSSGESTAFDLLISRSDEQFYRLVSDGYGPFEWQQDEK